MIRHVFDAWHRFWALSWWWKGPTLAVIPLISLTIGLGLVIAAGGGNKTADLEVTLKPTPTSTVVKLSPVPTATSEPPSQVSDPETTAETELAEQPPAAQQPPSQSTQPPAAQPTEPPPPVAQPSPPPPPPPPAPTPTPIDLQAVCANDALVIGDRVKGLYQAKGYPATTYEGLSNEADSVYYGLCVQSSDGYVDIYDFCYAVEAWRYFFDQEAGAQEWLDDCFARKFF